MLEILGVLSKGWNKYLCASFFSLNSQLSRNKPAERKCLGFAVTSVVLREGVQKHMFGDILCDDET